MKTKKQQKPTVLITGAAKRLGRATALAFAKQGFNIAIHFNHSEIEAKKLQQKIEKQHPVECATFQSDLTENKTAEKLIDACISYFGQLDHLINNASIFYPTPFLMTENEHITDFINVNCITPTNLAYCAYPYLKKTKGSIVNLIDIYADAGLLEHTPYVAAKSAFKAATQSQALEFAPDVRVNGVSPGAIMWPDQSVKSAEEELKQKEILERTSLKTLGDPKDIAATVCFLALQAHYTTGSVIRVDGGRRDFI